MANITHRQSFDQGILDSDALLLMKVNLNRLPAKTTEVVSNTIIGPNKIKEGDMIWFEDGYVTMETPRDMMLTEALQSVVRGYALALVNGKILKEYKKDQLAQAYEDLGRVAASIDVRVDFVDNDGDSAPEDDE